MKSEAIHDTLLKIGLIGTGVMGAPIAGHLMEAGYKVRIYNRTQSKMESLVQAGAVAEESPASLAEKCDVIFTVLGYPSDVRSIYLHETDGLIFRAKRSSILVDMTTSEPALAREISDAGASKGVSVFDAPLTGGDKGARAGTLSVMVGGDKSVYSKLQPILTAFSSKQVLQGGPGAGQCAKLTNQIALAGVLVSLCEALQFAEKSGLIPDKVIESIGQGAASSWQMQNLLPEILRGNDEPGFYAKHLLKDLEIAFHSSKDLGLDLPSLQLARKLFSELVEMGFGEKGTQALIHLYRKVNA